MEKEIKMLSDAGIRISNGRIAKADLERAKEVLSTKFDYEMFDSALRGVLEETKSKGRFGCYATYNLFKSGKIVVEIAFNHMTQGGWSSKPYVVSSRELTSKNLDEYKAKLREARLLANKIVDDLESW